jgi:hypothetical protein
MGEKRRVISNRVFSNFKILFYYQTSGQTACQHGFSHSFYSQQTFLPLLRHRLDKPESGPLPVKLANETTLFNPKIFLLTKEASCPYI